MKYLLIALLLFTFTAISAFGDSSTDQADDEIAAMGVSADDSAQGELALQVQTKPRWPEEFIIGADISWVPAEEHGGKRYSDRGEERDVLDILKSHGFNWIRLRIFVDPKAEGGYSADGFCGLEETLKMARRVKDADMKLLLDFHYSDTWADPGHQNKPLAWRDYDINQLEKAVEEYTADVVAEFKKQGVLPEMIQIGNEINHGMLWPEGRAANEKNLTRLIKAGVRGVRQVDESPLILLHSATGGQNGGSRWFYDMMLRNEVPFDIIGLSYYRQWHGTPDDLRANLADLAKRYDKKIIVVEYAELHHEVNNIVHEVPNGKGIGTFFWEPTRWKERLFDPEGKTTEAIGAYDELSEKFSSAGRDK